MLFYNFLPITSVSHFGPTFTYRYTKNPMYWYNVDLGPECPIWMALKVIDEGGRGPCLDQAHHKSSPWSNQPLSAGKECNVWIKYV